MGTEEDGVGQRTGGATRRDRSETELQRSRISGPMREFATWVPRSCILVWSSSTRRPMEFRAWIVEHRRGRRTDSPGERDWQSWGVSEGSCWAEKGHDTTSSFKVTGEEASTRIDVGFRGSSCVGPRGGTKGRREIRRCHGLGSGTRSLSEGKREVWEGIVHLATWYFVKCRGRKIEGAERANYTAPGGRLIYPSPPTNPNPVTHTPRHTTHDS